MQTLPRMNHLRRTPSIALLMFLATGCGAKSSVPVGPTNLAAKAPSQAAASPTSTRILGDNETLTSASGATWSAPKGFTLDTRPSAFHLKGPENDVELWLEERPAADSVTLAQQSWAAFRPGKEFVVKQDVPMPPKDGWSSVHQIVFSSKGSDELHIAVVRILGRTAYVALLAASEAGLSRRSANVNSMLGSLKVKGLDEETLSGKTANDFSADRVSKLDTFIEANLKTLGAPGLSIAVVQKGKLVWEKGFGTRSLGKRDPVTPRTLMMIGSTTKSLTTLMMARLVEKGVFTWDTPVKQVYPAFALGDAIATERATMKHTVCACTGLPRQDLEFLFEYGKETAEARILSMAKMKPTTAFGETFQYSNVMVSTGGYIAAHARKPKLPLNQAYVQTMDEEVLRPLGMSTSTFELKDALKREHASPHGRGLDEAFRLFPVQYELAVDAVRPAGALWSSAHEMAQWIQMELANGKAPSGATLISKEGLLTRYKKMVKVGTHENYGLGLLTNDVGGVQMVGHDGNTLGFTSLSFWFPEHDTGVTMLINAGGSNPLRNAIRRRVIELLFDAKERAQTDFDADLAIRKESLRIAFKDLDQTPDRTVLEKVAPKAPKEGRSGGVYTEPSLGTITLSDSPEGAIFDAGEWKSRFSTRKNDKGKYELVLIDPPLLGLSLEVGDESAPSLKLAAGQAEYVFKPSVVVR